MKSWSTEKIKANFPFHSLDAVAHFFFQLPPPPFIHKIDKGVSFLRNCDTASVGKWERMFGLLNRPICSDEGLVLETGQYPILFTVASKLP